MLTAHQIESLIQTAILAGEAILKVYEEKDFSKITDFKADNSPLTLADKNAHHVIVEQLAALFPEIHIISEEGDDISYDTRKHWSRYWLIDPLDGTKEFISRNGEFTVNIALMENNRPVWGVVYVPVQGILYYGGKNYGAYKSVAGSVQPIQASTRTSQLVAVGSRSHATVGEANELDIVKNVVAGSSLKFCMIAEGTADLYDRSGPTMEWDTAAGHALVEGAGGKMKMLDGNEFVYNKPNMLNPGFRCCNGEL